MIDAIVRSRRATAWAVVAALVLLVGAAAGGRPAVAIGLPTSVATIALAVALHRPKGDAWWWAVAGSVAWTAEEVVWALVRQTGYVQPAVPNGSWTLTDVLYALGSVLWLVALLRLPHKRVPIWTLSAVPPMLVLAWLLTRDPAQTLSLNFPIADLILLVAALPALEGALRGRASDGRLLWALGLFVRALTAANYSWLAGSGGSESPFRLLWLLAYLLIALGVWLEVRDESGGPWPAAAVLLGMEAVIFVTTSLLFLESGSFAEGRVTFATLAYVQLLAVMAVVIGDRRRRVKAESDLRGWKALIHRLAMSSASATRLERPLEGLWAEARGLLPDLQGMTAYAEPPLRLGVEKGYAFPIVRDGAEIGRLHFARQPDGSELLDALAPLIGQQIQQMQDHATWRDHAVTDPLTDLRNRRGFELELPRLLQSAHGRVDTLVVALIDLDHFKRVNDVYGHPVGDQVLVLLARLLRQHTRQDDLLVRWGGEEYLLLTTDLDEYAARAVMERLRQALVEATPAPLSHALTFSAGVSVGPVPRRQADVFDRIGAADAALLRAKRSGRDRIVTVSSRTGGTRVPADGQA